MERRLSAILAADVVGYSRLMGADEAGTLELKPDFTVSFIAQTLPFKNPAHLEHFLEGLRKVGLPE